MNKQDYDKYYIQGSDHYLIPKDVFDELFNEMENWKEEAKELKQKYLNAVADYETTMVEKKQLNSLVNSCQEEIRRLKKQLEDKEKKLFFTKNELEMRQKSIDNKLNHKQLKDLVKIEKSFIEIKNQQKEFIEYMNKTIEELECEDVDDEEMKDYLIQRIYTFKEIFSKYKEIIGGKE